MTGIDPIFINNAVNLITAAAENPPVSSSGIPASTPTSKKYQPSDFNNLNLLETLKKIDPNAFKYKKVIKSDDLSRPNTNERKALEMALTNFFNQLERLINTKQTDKAEKYLATLRNVKAGKLDDYSLLKVFLKSDLMSDKFLQLVYLPLLEADLSLAKIVPEDHIAARLKKTNYAVGLLAPTPNEKETSIIDYLKKIYEEDVAYLGAGSPLSKLGMRNTALRLFPRIYSTLAIAYYIQGNLGLSAPRINKDKAISDLKNAKSYANTAFRFSTLGEVPYKIVHTKFENLLYHCVEETTPDCEAKYKYSPGSDLVEYEMVLRPYQLRLIQTSLMHHQARIQEARDNFLPRPTLNAHKTKKKSWPNLMDIKIQTFGDDADVAKAPVIIFFYDKEYERLSLDFEHAARTYNKNLLGSAKIRISNFIIDLENDIGNSDLLTDANERIETRRQLRHLRLKYQVLQYKIQMTLAEDFEGEIKNIKDKVFVYKIKVKNDPEIKGDFENLNELDLLLADTEASDFYISVTKGQASLAQLTEAFEKLKKTHQAVMARNGREDIAQIRLRIQVKKAKLLQAATNYYTLTDLKNIPELKNIVKNNIPETLVSIRDNLLQPIDNMIEAMPLIELELRGAQMENTALSYFLATDKEVREKALHKFFEIYKKRTDDFAPRQKLWLYKMLGAITGRINEPKIYDYFKDNLGLDLTDFSPKKQAENEKLALEAIRGKLKNLKEDSINQTILGKIEDKLTRLKRQLAKAKDPQKSSIQTAIRKLEEKKKKIAGLVSEGKEIKGLIEEKNSVLISDLIKINREVQLQIENTNLSLASIAFDQKKVEGAKDLLTEARQSAEKILKEKDYACASTQADAYHLLIKIDQTRLGQLNFGNNKTVKAEDFYFLKDDPTTFKNGRPITIDSDLELIDFQKKVLQKIRKASFQIKLDYIKKPATKNEKAVIEEITKDFTGLDRMGEELFSEIGKYGFYQTLADTNFNLAYLNFDAGNITEYRSRYTEAFDWLNKILSAETNGSTLASARLSLAGFISAISGNHQEFGYLAKAMEKLSSSKVYFYDEKKIFVENELLMLARQLVGQVHKEKWFNGKAGVQANHTFNSLNLRLMELWSKLTFHRQLEQKDLPGKLHRDAVKKEFAHDSSPGEAKRAQAALIKILEKNMDYLTAAEKPKAREILDKLKNRSIKALQEFYDVFLNLETLKTNIKATVAAKRGDLSREASLLLQESRVYESSRKGSLHDSQKLMEDAVADLEKLKLEKFKPQSPLLEFQRQRMLADVYKIQGSIVQDLEGFVPKEKERHCKNADELFGKAEKMATKVRDATKTSRTGLSAQSEIILADLKYTRAGQYLLPSEELELLEEVKKDYTALLNKNIEFKVGVNKIKKMPVLAGQIRQNLRKSRADTIWRIGLLYRQIEGRKSNTARRNFETAGTLYGQLKEEGRTDLYASSQFNTLFMQFIRLGDDITVDLEYLIPKLRQRRDDLFSIHNQLANVMAENTFFGREFLSAHLFLANVHTQLEMMEYVLSGKTKDSKAFMISVEKAYKKFNRLSRDEIPELVLERDLNILGYNLATCGDGKTDREAEEALKKIVNEIQESQQKGEFSLIDNPNHSGRTLLVLKRFGMEANIRIGFFAIDDDRWGNKVNENNKTIISKLPGIIKKIKEQKAGATKESLLKDIRAFLKSKEPTVEDGNADYYFLQALKYGLDLLYSRRKDLKAQGRFWLAQLLSAIALDKVDRLNLAQHFAEKAFADKELEGETLLRAKLVILKVLSAKTGLAQDSLNPARNLFVSPFQGFKALSYAQELYQALNVSGLPREWRKLKAEILSEIAALYNWHTQYRTASLEHYDEVKTLLGDFKVLESFYYKIISRASVGRGDILRTDLLHRQNLAEAEKAYFDAFPPLLDPPKNNKEKEKEKEKEKINVPAKLDAILQTAKENKSLFLKNFDLSENDPYISFLAQYPLEKKQDPLDKKQNPRYVKTESQRTILTRIFLGLASLYGEYTWEKGKDLDRARVCLAIARQTLNSIKTPLTEHDQLDKQIKELQSRLGSIQLPQLGTTYNYAENKTPIPPPLHDFRTKFEYPFNLNWGPINDIRAGMELILSNKITKPVFTLGAQSGSSKYGIFTYGTGVGLLDGSLQADFAYNLRSILGISTSYQNTPIKGEKLRTHGSYSAFSFRPYPFLHELAPHVPGFRHADQAILNKILDGVNIGTSYNIFHQRTTNYGRSSLSQSTTFDRYQGTLFMDAGWNSWMFQNHVNLSVNYKHPLAAQILSGPTNSSERLGERSVVKFSPRIWQFGVIVNPHLVWKIKGVNVLPQFSLDGSFQQTPHPIHINESNISFWTLGGQVQFFIY